MTDHIRIEPTIAMLRGECAVFQHSWCGAMVIVNTRGATPRKPARGLMGACPYTGCEHPDHEWWEQKLPVGGYR
jgi:hypothetical protein